MAKNMNDDLSKCQRTILFSFLMIGLAVFAYLMLLTGCSYSVNVIHTQGEASDVVDETQTPTSEITSSFSLPLLK